MAKEMINEPEYRSVKILKLKCSDREKGKKT
jgi:hypothetical protein